LKIADAEPDPAGMRGGRARRSTGALENMVARAAVPSMECSQRCGRWGGAMRDLALKTSDERAGYEARSEGRVQGVHRGAEENSC